MEEGTKETGPAWATTFLEWAVSQPSPAKVQKDPSTLQHPAPLLPKEGKARSSEKPPEGY